MSWFRIEIGGGLLTGVKSSFLKEEGSDFVKLVSEIEDRKEDFLMGLVFLGDSTALTTNLRLR